MLEKIPAALTELPQWVVWRYVGDDKRKMPFQVSNEPAKANEPSTWTTFHLASTRLKMGDYEGVGFEFAKDGGIVGIDLDGCIDPLTKSYSPWAVDILTKLNSYSEVSPSGSGVKIFIRGKSPFERGRKIPVKQPKCCDKDPAIEIYDFGRYFAVTGRRLAKLSPGVEDRQAELQFVIDKYFPNEPAKTATPGQDWHSNDAIVERARKYMLKVPPAVSGNSGHNATYKAACILVCGFGLSEVDASQLLREWNQTCDPPWNENELAHKLKDAARATGERNYLRNIAPARWEEVKIPEYKPPQPKQSPPSKPKREPRMTTLEDATKKYLESVKSGTSKTIPLGIDMLDRAIGGGVEFGEMVVIAARPSHGKSAVALQFIHHATSRQMPCMFISEEMGALAIGKRVVQFATDMPESTWRPEIADLEANIEQHFKSRAPCYVAESSGSAEAVAEIVKRHVKDHGVKFVAIDYAQLLGSEGKGRYEQTTNACLALRQLVNETNVILLVLCQLNRAVEGRAGPFKPTAADIKDTGQFEQDADIIIFSVWPNKIDESAPKENYQFQVAKNRNRAIVSRCVDVVFNPERQTISDANPFDVVMYDNNGKMKQGAFSAFAENGGW